MNFGSCVLKASVGRVSVDNIGRYVDQHSANISTDTRSICRPRLGRMSVDINRQACRPTPGRYFNATRPPLGRHSATTRPPLGRYLTNTRPTLRSLIFSALLREAFSGRRPFLALNSGNSDVFFPAMFFPGHRFYIRPLLLSDAAAFGDCCFFPSIGHSGISSCESLLFLLCACREVALYMCSKWRQFELSTQEHRRWTLL